MKRISPRSTCLAVLLQIVLLTFAKPIWALPILMGASPDNSQRLLLTAINEAQKSILINVYELNSPIIVDALIQKITTNVPVRILVEGQPVGGYQPASITAQGRLIKAMKQGHSADKFLIMKAPTVKERRYHYDHAKYTVIDGYDVVVGSENYSPNAQTNPNTKGNRGWQSLIRSEKLAKFLTDTFMQDADTSYGDVHELSSFTDDGFPGAKMSLMALLTPNNSVLGDIHDFIFSKKPTLTDLKNDFSSFFDHNTPLKKIDGDIVDVYRSPDSSQEGLIRTLRRATRSLDIEIMSFTMDWAKLESPLFTEIKAAAQRGVRIRVLMNDPTVFGGEPGTGGNIKTLNALKQLGQKLPVQARIGNMKAMNVTYIHNKGLIVDDSLVLFSSINWTQNAVKNNRELGVLIGGDGAGAYYSKLFEEDWQASRNFIDEP